MAALERYKQDRELHTLIAAPAHISATDPTYAQLVSAIAEQANVARATASAIDEQNVHA